MGEESLLIVVFVFGGGDVAEGCAEVVEDEEEKPGIYTILTVDGRLVIERCLAVLSSCFVRRRRFRLHQWRAKPLMQGIQISFCKTSPAGVKVRGTYRPALTPP